MKGNRRIMIQILVGLMLVTTCLPMFPIGARAAGTLPQYWSASAIKCTDAACPALSNYDANYANNVMTLRTSNGKLQTQGDTMYTTSTPITGDFTVTAKVNNFKNQPSNATDTTGAGALSYQNKALLFVKKVIDKNDSNASSISPSIMLSFQPKQSAEVNGSGVLKNSSYVYAWQNHVSSLTSAGNVGTAVSETNQLAGYPILTSDLSTKSLYFKLVKRTDSVSKNSTYSAYISNDGSNYGNGTTTGIALYSFTDANNAVFGTGSVYIGLGVDYGTVEFSQVSIVDAFGNAVFPSSLSSSTPTGLYTIAGNTKATVGWTAVTGATSYNVKRGTTSGGPYQLVTNVTTNSYTDSNLLNDTTYYYVINAVTGSGESPDSLQANVTPVYTPDPPPAPTGLKGTSRDSQVSLQWDAVQGSDSYNVLRSSDGGAVYTNIASGLTTTSYTDAGLTDGTSYMYVVQSKNVGGVSGNSTSLLIAPVSTLVSPTNLTAATGNSKVDLSWNSVTGATYYTVKRSTLSGRSYSAVASNLSTPLFTDTTVVNGNSYYYVVSASNAQTESMNTNEVIVTPNNVPSGSPSTPGDLVGEARDSEISLTWTAVSGVSTYHVQRATALTGPYTTIANLTGTSYVDNSVVNGATYFYHVSAVNGNGESASSAAAIATPAHVIVVAKDGTGDFATVQSAVDSIPGGNTIRQVIYIRNGIYSEKVTVPSTKPYLSFVGESRDGTILTYNDYGNAVGTSNSYTVSVSANSFTAENVTIQNTAFSRTAVGPAVALYVTADRAVFTNVRLAGFQDTLYVNAGRQYFKNAIIEGDVDWIFGNATAIFDNSEIKFVGNGGGHTTAASTDQLASYGYVFLNSKLTRGTSSLKNAVTLGTWDPSWDIDNNIAATNGSVDLGRPWRAYANVKYINTWMDAHIKTVGWDNWGSAANELTALYGEYNTSGPGANPKGRYKWTTQLTASEANLYTVQNVSKGTDGWDPTLIGVIPQKPQSAKPASPTSLSAALGYSQINLGWNAVAGAKTYFIYRSLTAGGPYTQLVTSLTATAYSDTTISLGTAYFYKVSAVNDSGESALSSEAAILSKGTFDRKTTNQADLSVAVQVLGETVTGLANGTSQLAPTTDYSVYGNLYKINKSYLTQLPIGATTLTFTFSSGNTLSYVVQVVNTTPLPSQTISNVPTLQLYTIEGVAPFLPSIVPVNFTDQTEKALRVNWNQVNQAQYASAGSFTAQGVVAGTTVPVTAIVTVQALNTVSAVTGGTELSSYLTNLPFTMPAISLYSYPNQDFNIQDYGAVGDGVTKNTTSIANAIAAAANAGGGRVVVPAGDWLTGPIQMKSNINFHLEEGARILFSPDYSDYTPGSTRYQSMFVAIGLSNIAITGNGVIDGNGQYWRYVKKSKVTAGQWTYLLSLGGVVSDDGSIWYPSQQAINVGRPLMVEVTNSTNVLIDGPTFMNSPQFATSFTSDRNLVIRNTTVNNDAWYQNGDGLDVTSSQNVVMYHNTVNAGDDGIGMKSSNDPGPTTTLSNVVVADNIVFRGHGGLSIGSNTSGGINNLAVRNNQYIGTDAGINIKSYVGNGGPIQNLYFDDIHMQNIGGAAISISDFYNGHDAVLDNAQLGVDRRVPEIKNIRIRNITVDGAEQGVNIEALVQVPVHDIELTNVKITAATGWVSTNTANVQLNNVQITPASGVLYTLTNASNVLFNNVFIPRGTSTFIHLAGSASNIQMKQTDYSAAGVPFQLDQGISPSVIRILDPGLEQVPKAPVNLSSFIGNSEVHLIWEAISGATSYNVKRSTTLGTGYQTIASNVTGTTYTDADLLANTYYYVVTASNGVGESGSSNEVVVALANTSAGLPVANLTGAASSYVGQNINFIYGLNMDNSVHTSVYGQDLTFQYNPNLMSFVSAESLVPGLTVVNVDQETIGKVRIFLASLNGGVRTSGDLLKLIWKATGTEQPGDATTLIYLNQIVIADEVGTEVTLNHAFATLQLQINKSVLVAKLDEVSALTADNYTPTSWAVLQAYLASAIAVNTNPLSTQSQVNAAVFNLQTAEELLKSVSIKSPLSLKIASVSDILISVSIGERWGQYAQSEATALNASISSAVLVRNNPNADQVAIDQALTDLDHKLQHFLNAIHTKASIGDLAIISASYGMTSVSSSWVQNRRYDMNQDNKLDIVDLVAIARKVLGN